MKIKNLTEDQIATFPTYVREWTRIGLCTDPADRPRAEAAIAKMYAGAGFDRPLMVWVDSPIAAAMAGAMMKEKDQVSDQVWDQVRDQVWAQVRAQVRDQVSDQVRAQVWAMIFGQHDASWLSFYKFFADNGLSKEASALEGLLELCQSSGWCLPYKGVCILSERHSVCALDDQGRLHAEHGPAILYPDGFAVYAWHGQRVPAEWIIDRASLTPKVALGQTDGNLRAAAIQIVGWGRMMAELGATVIDRHPEGMAGGEILAVPKSKVEPSARGTMKFLRAECPRNGIICFRVPDDVTKAHEAQAWRVGIDPKIYQLPSTRT